MKTRFALFALGCLIPWMAPAQVHLEALKRTGPQIQLTWRGGFGPYQLETSTDLSHWVDVGDPLPGREQTLTAAAEQAFYRVTDWNPANVAGPLLGLVQTDQGEFGTLLARHRLKTRLWIYKTKAPVHTTPSYAPSEYWRKLWVQYQFVDEDRVRTWAGALEDLGTVAEPTAQRMTVTWTRGAGATLRSYVLTLDFPYSLRANRTSPALASDPSYELRCTYATPQPEFDPFLLKLERASSDHVKLYELAVGAAPGWAEKNYRVSRNGAQIQLHFVEGLPLLEGNPPFIWKTLILDRWLAPTTGAGGTLPAFSTDSYFARTLLPGHHNFYEMVLIDPALEPSLPESTRRAFRQANIRWIYTFKDVAGVVVDGNSEDIRYIGYDERFREP